MVGAESGAVAAAREVFVVLAVVVFVAFDFAADAAVPDVAELVVAFAALALVILLGGVTSESIITMVYEELRWCCCCR